MKRTFKALTFFLINFLFVSFLYAQSDIDKKYRIFSNWQIDDGLPQNSVFSVVQDKKGYVFAGTAEGFAKFDGVRFQKFDAENSGLSFESIRVLFRDEQGSVWIGGQGLAKMTGDTIIPVKTSENAATDLVRAVFKDRSDRIFIGTYDNGLKIIDKEKITHLNTKTKLPSNTVHSIIQDSSQRIWIGTSNGICLFKDEKCTKNRVQAKLSGQIVRVIFEDSSGDLWIGTQTGGIYHFHKGSFINYSKKNGLSHNWISSVIENEDGDIIVGTFGGGINIISKGKIHHYGLKDGLSDIKITSLAVDHEKNIWAGTWQGGLNQFRKSRFFNQTAQNRLDSLLPAVIFEDSRKNIWIGTRDGGIFLFRDNKFVRQFTTSDGLSTNIINTIFETPQGNVAVSCDNGEKHGGLHVFNGKSFDPYLPEINTGDISVVVQDKNGVIWIGTYRNGLYSLNKGEINRYKKEFSGKVIRTMLVDHKNRLWIGTSGKNASLVKLEDGKIMAYSGKDGLSSNIILSLYEDRDHNLWLGSNGGGLILLKNENFHSFTKNNGFFDNRVFSILEDSSENLWMSSNNGIFTVNKSDLYKHIENSGHKIKYKAFGVHDGMRTRECNGGFFPSAVAASDGHFIFPTIKGVVSLDPDNEIINKSIPPVHIENVTVDGTKSENTVFDPATGRIEFEYTALSFAVPERVRFKYMLEGVDSTWIDAGQRRTAYYTNLPSGSFTFRVIAANNDEIWNSEGASFSFKITPHFYETLWFKTLSGLLLIIFIWAIVRLRTYRIAVQKKKLEELVLEKAQELNAAQEELVDVNSELKEKYRTSTLDSDIAQEYVKNLKNFMESEKPYLDEDLTIANLSQMLSMSSHHLSQVINGELNQNFYTFLNTYRANEVREELKKEENKNENILILAYKAGFKSKSSFNIIFKKINGITPTEFRKNHFNS